MLVKKLLLLFLLLITTTYAKNVLQNIFIQSYIDGKIKGFLKKLDQNNQCLKDMLHVATGLKNKEMWAMTMFDSTSKLNPGLLNGNIVHYGLFDACLAIDHSLNNSTNIKGKYCIYTIKIRGVLTDQIDKFKSRVRIDQLMNSIKNYQIEYVNLNDGSIPIFGALCIPDSCKAQDLDKMYNALEINKSINGTLMLNDSFCQTTEDFNYSKWKTSAWLGIAFFAFIGLLMFTNTAYHAYLIIFNKKPIHRIFLVFSVYANIKKLMSTKDDPDQILCINGLRTISMMWIILGHRFLFSILSTNINIIDVFKKWMIGPVAAIMFSAALAVDTFFVISGVLVIYIVLTAKSKGIKFTLLHYYLHRYIRLTPALGAVIILYVTFYQKLSYGPIWPLNGGVVEPCYTNWWITLLYIQNFWEVDNICVAQSWYLGIDTQLYALAPVIFFPLQKWPVLTLFVMVILILMSSYIAFYTSWINHIEGHPIMSVTNFTNLYASTPVRLNAWLIGGIIGYILFKAQGKKTNINKFVAFSIWITVLLIMTCIVFQIMIFTNYDVSQIYTSLYYGFTRDVWCIGVGWIIWACVQGYGGIINTFLSHKIFTILGRLTYSMYLLQIGMIILYFGRTQTPGYFSNFVAMHNFWGDFVFITAAALLWCLAFESPIIAIGKLFIPEGRKKLTQTPQETNGLSRF